MSPVIDQEGNQVGNQVGNQGAVHWYESLVKNAKNALIDVSDVVDNILNCGGPRSNLPPAKTYQAKAGDTAQQDGSHPPALRPAESAVHTDRSQIIIANDRAKLSESGRRPPDRAGGGIAGGDGAGAGGPRFGGGLEAGEAVAGAGGGGAGVEAEAGVLPGSVPPAPTTGGGAVAGGGIAGGAGEHHHALKLIAQENEKNEKKRNALYLRAYYDETKGIEFKKNPQKENGIFFVLTDQDESKDGNKDENKSINYKELKVSKSDNFFKILNEDPIFSDDCEVRFCFMQSDSPQKVGSCDITKQNFIDINNSLGKTRIFLDDAGITAIEDYRIKLEEKFKAYLDENIHKKVSDQGFQSLPDFKNIKGFGDIDTLKTLTQELLPAPAPDPSLSLSPSLSPSQGDYVLKKMGFVSDVKKIHNVLGKGEEKQKLINEIASKMADKCLVNRFKSGIIGVEKEVYPSPNPADVGSSPVPASPQYQPVQIGFIKVVRPKNDLNKVQIFVGEKAGPTTANIWDKDTKSYVQIELEKSGDDIIGIKEAKQIDKDGETPKQKSKLNIDVYTETNGKKSGLFKSRDSSVAGIVDPQEIKLFKKQEIRDGKFDSTQNTDPKFCITNLHAHEENRENIFKDPAGGADTEKVAIGKLNVKNKALEVNPPKDLEIKKTESGYKIEIEGVNSPKKDDNQALFSEYDGKTLPELKNPSINITECHFAFVDKDGRAVEISGDPLKPKNVSVSITSSPDNTSKSSPPSSGPSSPGARCVSWNGAGKTKS